MTQTWDAGRYAKHARFVSDLGAAVVELLGPARGECVLDLGCGDGALSERLVAAGCRVVAVDASPDMVAAARARGLDARLMDGQALCFDAEFDAVFSNAALHWMRRADDVIAGVVCALKPGGRFVAEFGGGDNVKTISDAFERALCRRGVDVARINPWYFPAPGEYRRRLQAHGLTVRCMDLFARPTPIPGDISGWLQTFGESFLGGVPAGERDELLAEVRCALRPMLCDGQGNWTVDYVRLRFAAFMPGAARG